MKKSFLNPLIAAWLALAVLTALPALRAQTETKPAEEPVVAPEPAVEPEKKADAGMVPAAPEAEEPVAVESVKESEVPPGEEKSAELRELGNEPTPEPEKKPAVSKKKRSSRSYNGDHDEIPIGNHHVAAGTKRGESVSIFGNTTIDGEVGQAVSIGGNSVVNGRVNGELVTIMGNTTINGRAHDVVTVMGDVILGPEAVVTGDITVTMGSLKKAAGAQVLGDVHEVSNFGNFGGNGGFEGLHAWFTKCLMLGRPLGIGENLGWIWVVAGAFLIFYMMLALIFPRGVVRSAETLEQRPGATILAAFLTIIITPVAFVLLAVTGIGIVLIPFVIIALLFGSLFGMSAMLAWFGRRVFGTSEQGITGQPFFAVFIGGLIVSLLYMIPFLGFILWKLFGILGLGMVVYALIQASKRDKPRAAGVPAVAATPVYAQPPAMSAGFTSSALATEPGVAATAETIPPLHSAFVPPVLPVISAATLPRAGFWIRIAAAALDAVLVGMMCGFIGSFWHNFDDMFLFWYALYCVCFWATKSTTVGGIICSLKVVRLDDRPLDWGVAVVRALGGFLSLCVAGLGFIWVAFDDEKQSWHDKIAGTTIVRVPKGTPLL